MDPLSLLRWTADQLASGPGAIAVVLRVEGSVPRRTECRGTGRQ